MKRLMSSMVLFVFVVAGSARSASAYERSRDPDTDVCLWREERTITILVNENCSSDLPLEDCLAGVQSAVDAWNEPECSDMQIVFGGTTLRTDVGFDPDHWEDNINLIIWHESLWEEDPRAVSLSTVTYDTKDGRIFDADLELNGVGYDYDTEVSVHNVLIYEIGHMIGLDHSRNRSSVMFSQPDLTEDKKRSLSQDDVDALCHIYPAGEETPDCSNPDDPSDGGSGCISAGEPGSAWQFVFIALLTAFILRRSY